MNERAKTNQELIKENATLKQKIQELELAESGQKRAEKLLREYEERYRALFDRSLDLVYITDFEGRFIDANDAALNRLGYTREEIHTLNFASFLDEDQFLTAFKTLQEIRETGIHKDMMEFRLRHKNGSYVYVETRGSTITSNRTPIAIQSIARDITERKRNEEVLRSLAVRNEAILSAVPDIVMEVDQTKRYTWANQSGLQFFGEDVVGREASYYFEGEQEINNIVNSLFNGDEDVIYLESWQRRQDGKKRLLAWWCKVLKDKHGDVTGALSTARDITDQHRTEEAFRSNKVQLSNALEMAHLGHWEYDVANDLFTFNDHFYNLFRTTVEQVGGYTMPSAEYARRFVHPDDMNLVFEETRKAIETSDPHFTEQLEHRMRYADGTVGYISVRFLIVKDSDGRTVKTYGVNQDITERKRAEEEKRSMEERLLRAEKMEALGTLAGGVAHDLNNVLGIVVGYAEMVLDEIDESNPMRNDLMKIMEGGHRSAAIVQDLLTLARRGVQTRKVINLNVTIRDCQKTPEFGKVLSFSPKVQMRTDFEADILSIMGSPVHLSKTIMNLVSNAAEAMPDGGNLTIRTSNQYLDRPIQGYDAVRDGDYVVLTVSDTGEGIPENDIKRIFEPFYTKKVMGRSGTGLGLAVVWGTVKDHNGYINVQSKEGKGTTFTIYFPVTREEINIDQALAPAPTYMGKGETILVVDDVDGQRELASRMLTKLNYKVTMVGSGEEAIGYLKINKADLIVLDMIMDPGIDGLETYKKILDINPTQKAIIVSGFSESERVHEVQELGAGPYVKKPYVLERLGTAARNELDKKWKAV